MSHTNFGILSPLSHNTEEPLMLFTLRGSTIDVTLSNEMLDAPLTSNVIQYFTSQLMALVQNNRTTVDKELSTGRYYNLCIANYEYQSFSNEIPLVLITQNQSNICYYTSTLLSVLQYDNRNVECFIKSIKEEILNSQEADFYLDILTHEMVS